MNVYLAHLIGDYILQNDFLADGKKKSSWICALHVLLYLIPFWFTSLLWWKILLIGVEHFVQDRTEVVVWFMKMKGSEKFSQSPCGPWSIIVTDNILHIMFIAWMASL